MFSLQSKLLNRQDRSDSLRDMKPRKAAEAFSRFFQSFFFLIEKIRQGFVDGPSEESDAKEHLISSVPPVHMISCFHALSGDQILKHIHASKPTTAAADPLSTKFVLEFTNVLLPVLQKIVNLSLESGTVPRGTQKSSR